MTEIGLLPEALAHASVVVAGDTAYVVGGRTVAGTTGRAVVAVTTHSVRRVGGAPVPVADSAAATLGSTTFLVGGWNRQTLATVLEVSPR